ncbi:cytochrome P450 [Auriscalpium vulgare]|uniref:Cytochrome P450 n=1 Tax=Auriscalpium vulgare TaxID=40419 RepID=A0ACB8RFZ0_9AGAM|nr:cytochrome P450 [Auriscalpium vulgare]
MLSLTALLVSLIILFAGARSLDSWRRRRGLPYPPGPRGLPVIGCLFSVPKTYSWIKYDQWAKKYGGIISFSVCGQIVVVISDLEVAEELLGRRSAIYSDRLKIPFYEMMDWSWFLLGMPFGERWRRGRKTAVRTLQPSQMPRYHDLLKSKVHKFLKVVRANPAGFHESIGFMQGAIIMGAVYGYDLQGPDDYYLKIAQDANLISRAIVLPGGQVLNDVPFLRYLPKFVPGVGFNYVRLGNRLGQEMVRSPFEMVKAQMDAGTAQQSITRDCLEQLEHSDDDHDAKALADVVGSLYIAGADTTIISMASIIMALASNPDIQQRAQEEVDILTRRARLPEFADRPNLPYINAMCKEVLRWRVVAPLSFPHAVIEDDVYNGFFIPKGATVIPNIRAILNDPVRFPDPERFNPERFLSSDGHTFVDDPVLSAAFGFGRRMCPGQYLAEATLFIFTAALVSTFDVGKEKDAHGREMPLECIYGGEILSHPAPFKCSLVPRDGIADELISATSWGE